ncbi:MAG TPA: ThiF family adenylyltransferase [Ignavibacteria bacterium]|nr:ThiF family adenylyltransferase [Ignavibacteria bacterium]HRK00219.1 ThiF family adenylyltransferase [Ignavibacteria bacterium]
MEIIDDRYSRLELITWWDQNILKNARILVAGCGALGNEIVKNLTMLGVGNIFTADMDKVEKSNLTRSVLFRYEDEGRSKAETICRRAREINDGINLKYFNGNIFRLGLGVFKNFDIIIGGLDNREARLFINQSCWKISRPWIDGAIEVLNGVARAFIPPFGACYECTMSEIDYKIINKRKSCMLLGIDDIIQGKIPTTPTIASVIGGIQAQEAVKYLHKREDLMLLSGKGFVFNGGNNDSYIVEYQRNEDCPSHYTFEKIVHSDKKFSEAGLKDLYEIGKELFHSDSFQIEFNNETVYELTDEATGKTFEHFENLNLMSVRDVKKDDGSILKFRSFNSLNTNSDLYERLHGKTFSEMKLPYNDIIILRKNEEEFYVEFEPDEIFSE